MEEAPVTPPRPRVPLRFVIGNIILLYAVATGVSALVWDRPDPTIMYVPVYILMWGFVGGVVSVLYYSAFPRPYDPGIDLRSWVIVKPFVGAIMGGLVYFGAVAGELFLNGRIQIQNIEFLNILAFFAGFSDRFSIDMIDKLVNRSLSASPESGAAEPPEPRRARRRRSA